MKTTLDIDDRLLARAKSVAAREQTSLTRLIEEGLALRLRPKIAAQAKRLPELPTFDGGTGFRPGIDPLSNKSIYDALDEP